VVKERPVVAVQKGDPHSFELQLAEAAMIRLAGGFNGGAEALRVVVHVA